MVPERTKTYGYKLASKMTVNVFSQPHPIKSWNPENLSWLKRDHSKEILVSCFVRCLSTLGIDHLIWYITLDIELQYLRPQKRLLQYFILYESTSIYLVIKRRNWKGRSYLMHKGEDHI